MQSASRNEMDGKKQKRKKNTIFKIFLIPLIIIMLIQSLITMGTLVVRRTAGMLEEYSSSMMNRLVENRRVILQNDMIQRWASVHQQETLLNNIFSHFLQKKGVELEDFFQSGEMKKELLEELFPECLSVLQNNSTSGIFLVLTGTDMEAAGDFDGFFIRDSDPDTNPANYTDLLLERGSKHLSRAWNIPLDTCWTTRFHMDGQGKDSSDNYFYEPWRAGDEHADVDAGDLGYWSMPFSLETTTDSHEIITYSLPLRYEGKVYGVLGVEISSKKLYDYFPVVELNDAQQSGYMLAVRQNDGSYAPLVGKGVLYNIVCSASHTFILENTDYENLSLVQNIQLDKDGVYAVVCPLKLYSSHVPYENTEWVLLGLNTEDDLFGMSRELYIWMVIAILIGLIFGVFGIYFMVRHLTKPVQRLMQCISGGRDGLREFRPSNILEVDALYDVMNELTERQKEAENILLEEKERYRLSLESSKDVFFSYDLQSHMLDIVNHKTKSGQWLCEEFESGFIDPEYIYDMDRAGVIKALQSKEDKLFVEFRMKWPEDEDFKWVAFTGKAVYDIDEDGGSWWEVLGIYRSRRKRRRNSFGKIQRMESQESMGSVLV